MEDFTPALVLDWDLVLVKLALKLLSSLLLETTILTMLALFLVIIIYFLAGVQTVVLAIKTATSLPAWETTVISPFTTNLATTT